MNTVFRVFSFFSFALLAACAADGGTYQKYMQAKGVSDSSPEKFQHCHGYGCKFITPVSLTKAQLKEIEAVFSPASSTAEEERTRIAKAIGIFETHVGRAAGTDSDVHGTFMKIGRDQLDCVDESTNTTVYLSLLHDKGLITFHNIEAPTTRIPLIHYMGRWPHQTASIVQKSNGARFAVDSWFHDNGAPAEIIPMDEWKSGWKPKKTHDSF